MDDLISEFITETSESLAVLDLELVKLEQNPNDKNILGNIFRLVHTIKGTCGFLGLPRLEHVAHAGENILGKIRDDEIEVTPGTISIVLEALDHIKDLIEYLSENGEEPQGSDEALVARLNAYAEGGGDDAAEAAAAGAGNAAEPEEELDELERAFRDAECTVEGGLMTPAELAKAQQAEAQAAAEPVAEAPQAKPAAAAAAVSEQAKAEALVQGLQAEPKDAQSGGSSAANQSIRVSLGVLDNLMQMVGELVLTRNQLMQIVRNRNDNELKTPLQHLSHITTELQEGVMKTRMQPIGNAWAKFPRLIRDLSIELNKKIELRMIGAETELDRQLLEMIKDPLTHMVRNSCDHGLERPADRKEAGKTETGIVTLSAYHEGGHIIIEISDDGRGVNIERISQKAIENGLATPEEIAALSDQQIAQFIFKAGFSTAEQVTSVSGRGVGMDVVRTNIEKIGGTVELQSVPGRGSTFHIKIPLTLAIVSVLIVQSGGERFAIPQINVLELVRAADDSEYRIEDINGSPVLRLRDKLLPLVGLNKALGLSRPAKSETKDAFGFEDEDEEFIVVCRVGGYDFGIIVDKIFDTEEIVVKPVSSLLQDIDVYSGNTILGDGSVIMILDPNGLSKLLGDSDAPSKDALEADEAMKAAAERLSSFLLFASGKGAPKAVPLELVSRLEEIDAHQIESSGDLPVIQYRDDLMRLKRLSNEPLPTEGKCEVIVFTYDGKTIGLVVDEILDIVEAPMKIKMSSETELYMGSQVIEGKTTDVVDVGHLLKDVIDDQALSVLEAKHRADGDVSIMLVEDSLFFRRMTVSFLENLGYKVTSFGWAKEALEALRSGERYDVIITDIEMPEMNGLQFAERVRSDSQHDVIPIVAFTSTVNQQFMEKGKEMGINHFVMKTERERLVQMVSQLVRGEAVSNQEVA